MHMVYASIILKVMLLKIIPDLWLCNSLAKAYWHEYLDLILFYKITPGLITINPDVLPTCSIARPTIQFCYCCLNSIIIIHFF